MDTTQQDTASAVRDPAYVLSRSELKTLGKAADILARLTSDAMSATWDMPNVPGSDLPHPAGLGRIAESADTARNALYSLAINCDVYGVERHASDELRRREDAAAARRKS